jgi:hypothetical protein
VLLDILQTDIIFGLLALEHIKSGGLSLTPRLSERSKLTLGRSSRLQTLFKAIEDNDVAGAKFILESSDEDLDSPDAGYPDHIEGMCHPLCTCSKCSDGSQVTNRGDSRSQRASLSLEQVTADSKKQLTISITPFCVFSAAFLKFYVKFKGTRTIR